MDYNDFREFFKTHVKEYGPYQDSKMFQSFSNFLTDSYYNDSYNNIPVAFKDAFEKQIIPSDFVVPMLQSLGIPDSDINKIPNSDRFKIINMISDFHRYKGTVTLIDRLVANFDTTDNIAVYELYLNLKIDINGSRVWEVLPKQISKGAGFRASLSLTSPELFTLLDQALNWFIDEQTLNTLYDSGELILPYKTNCILLDSTILNNLEPIVQIVSELVVETFKDSKIQLFFKDGVYLSTFSNTNMLWYYISNKLYSKGNNTLFNTSAHIFNGSSIFTRYVIPNIDGSLSRNGVSDMNSSVTNIQTLIDEYAKLSTSNSTSGQTINEFYTKYIDIFSPVRFPRSTTFVEYRASVISSVGIELISYIDNRIDTAINAKNEASLIGSEIYSSLLTFKSLNPTTFNSDYLDYYYLNLPGLIKDIKNSTTYVMLNLLKPYHSDLIDRQHQKTICSSKFDNALVSYAKSFATVMNAVNNSSPSELSIFNPTTLVYDNLHHSDLAMYNIIYSMIKYPDLALSEHAKNMIVLTSKVSTSQALDLISNIMPIFITIHKVAFIDVLNMINVIYSFKGSFEILLDFSNNIMNTTEVSLESMSDMVRRLSVIIPEFQDILYINIFNTITKNQIIEIFKNIENILHGILIEHLETTITQDSNNIINNIIFNDSVLSSDIVTSYIYDNPTTGVHIVYTN